MQHRKVPYVSNKFVSSRIIRFDIIDLIGTVKLNEHDHTFQNIQKQDKPRLTPPAYDKLTIVGTGIIMKKC